jgi:hypothetical protein
MVVSFLRESSLGTVVGQLIGWSAGGCRGRRHARCAIRSPRQSNTFCLVVWLPEKFGRGHFTSGIGLPGFQRLTPSFFSGGPLGRV